MDKKKTGELIKGALQIVRAQARARRRTILECSIFVLVIGALFVRLYCGFLTNHIYFGGYLLYHDWVFIALILLIVGIRYMVPATPMRCIAWRTPMGPLKSTSKQPLDRCSTPVSFCLRFFYIFFTIIAIPEMINSTNTRRFASFSSMSLLHPIPEKRPSNTTGINSKACFRPARVMIPRNP